ncbi:MAG: relaxase/mobilization nuclease domain-containing protein [Lachnospiraceae bacterium]|nr:relaxase/mobilization nuclease domain-containing protein [Lachnospiraceae bacterium]
MPYIKPANGNYSSIEDVANLIGYVLNPEKRCNDIWGTRLLYSSPDHKMTAQQIIDINLHYGKTQGSLMKHIIISYSYLDGPITVELIHNALKAVLSTILFGFPCVYALHENTAHPHFHLALGSVNLYTGMKYPDTKETLRIIADTMAMYTSYKTMDGKTVFLKYNTIADKMV